MPGAERADYGEVVLGTRLRDALARLNPELPAEALEDAFRKLARPEGADLVQRNRAPHRMLVDGVTVEQRDAGGAIRSAQVGGIDCDEPADNDWLAVNQFPVIENQRSRRPDVVLFVNGVPLVVLELKNAASEDATIWSACQQLRTYRAEVPAPFATERCWLCRTASRRGPGRSRRARSGSRHGARSRARRRPLRLGPEPRRQAR